MTFFHDQQRNLLIYPLSAGAPLHALPDARRINGQFFAVPRTLVNSQVLRFYNYDVPSIMDGYTWPISPEEKPWEHQKLAANFAVLHPRSFNLSDLGSGKTRSLLWASDYVMQQFPRGKCRTLVVAPLSTLRSVWETEIFRHLLGRRKCTVLHGTPEKRVSELARDVDYYLINHDGLSVGAHTRKRLELDGFSKILAERDDIKIVIVDEASAYKDSGTKRHRIARLVIGGKPYLYLLTGTPTPQAPTDAYGLSKLVNNAFGMSKSTFQQNTMIQISPYKWVPRKDGYEQARRILTPAIRFDINDVWKNAPELTLQSREAPLTVEQKKHMADLKRDLVLTMRGGQISAANEAAARSKYLQISAGAVYDSGHKAHLIDASGRVDVLKELIEQSPMKMLILASFTSVLTFLSRELKEYSHVMVNGSTPMRERSDIFDRFQNGDDPQILLADPGVLAHGLNLQRGRTIVWYTPVDKGELFIQANKRCHRPGQKFPVSVVQIVSNSLEVEIYKRLAANTSLQGLMLDMVARGEV